MTLEEQYDKWRKEYVTSLGWAIQYEDKYEMMRAAFMAGYELARISLAVPKEL